MIQTTLLLRGAALARPVLFGTAALMALATSTTRAQTGGSADDVIKLNEFQVSTTADKGYRAGNSVVRDAHQHPDQGPAVFHQCVHAAVHHRRGRPRPFGTSCSMPPASRVPARSSMRATPSHNIRGFDQAPQHNGFVGEGYIDTVSIERVEVVKGPSSVLYGQVAPGGTVNYITKRPGAQASTSVNAQIGTQSFMRTSLDLNQPLIGKTLLFRLNGAWENGFEYIKPGEQQTTVLAPVVTWRPVEKLSLTVDYQWFSRRETPPSAQIKPNIEIVALPGANGLLPTGGVLVKPDNSDPGFLSYYPLPRGFQLPLEQRQSRLRL